MVAAGNALGGERPLRGKRSPSSLGNPVNAAQHRDDTDRLLRMTEGGTFGGEDHVRPDCQFEPATETKSLDGDNYGQRKPLKAV